MKRVLLVWCILALALILFAKSIDLLSLVDSPRTRTAIKTFAFPQNFLFGAAVASFQVEYDQNEKVDTNWSRFLKKHPKTISQYEIGPNWFQEGKAEEDIDRFASLGIKALRMSFEWARIEPKPGVFDTKAVKRYRAIIDYAKSMGLTPMITIHHFTNPGWFEDMGGWEKKENVNYFLDYTKKLTQEFPDVTYWVTVNEPNVYVNNGYLVGAFPPEKHSPLAAFKARNNIVNASNKTYELIKHVLPDSQVGAVFATRFYFPSRENSLLDTFIANLANYVETVNYLEGMSKNTDFIGINYYTAYKIRFSPTTFKLTMRKGVNGIPETLFLGRTITPNTAYISDMGWPIYPQAFYDTLQIVNRRYHKPIIITENGISDAQDQYRAFYLFTHFAAVQKAINNGVDVRGYFYWSGVDNLEWADGYTREFGLVHVDKKTGERTIRDSAYLYQNVIQNKRVDVDEAIETFIKDPKQQQEARKIVGAL